MPVRLFLAAVLALLCFACVPAKQAPLAPAPPAPPVSTVSPPPPPLPPPPKAADPASMSYRSKWRPSGQVTLVQGIYRTPVAPGSAEELIVRLTDQRVFGTIDGKEVGAVVLLTLAGGSGSFYDLALLTRKGPEWVNSDMVALGDRIDVHGLTLRGNQVVVTMTTHGPNDLMCCPTQRVERRFTVQGGKLVAETLHSE